MIEPFHGALAGSYAGRAREISPAEHLRIDDLEARLLASAELGEAPVVELPVEHHFTPGLYRRTIFMPAGTLLTSKIHKTEHPYVVTSGKVAVYIPGVGVEHIEAPYYGTTKANTRRVLYIVEDCTWTTYHPLVGDEGVNGEADLPAIEERIIEKRLLGDGTSAFEHYKQLLIEAQRAFGVVECEQQFAQEDNTDG